MPRRTGCQTGACVSLAARGGAARGPRAAPSRSRRCAHPGAGGLTLLYAVESGPIRAKTYALDALIVVGMRGSGVTPLEKTMMDTGDAERVVAMRHEFQHMMTKRFTDTIGGAHGPQGARVPLTRHVEPVISLEICFVDGPLKGFGAFEVIERE